MFYWIYNYPSWVIEALFCFLSVGLTWSGIFLTRLTFHSWIHREKRTNDMVGVALSSYFVLFGLLLGLLSVATYQNYNDIGNLVDKEASSIGSLYRDFAAYPQPIRGQLEDRLREYARYTIEEDWPKMRKGIVPEGGTVRVNELFKVLVAFEPIKKSEVIFHTEAVEEFNNLIVLRRDRLASVSTGLPAVLWWVVMFGALGNIVLIWLQDMQIHVHLILGGVLASILGLVIFSIAALDNPFRGSVSVGPDAIALVYETLLEQSSPGTGKPAPGASVVSNVPAHIRRTNKRI
ncbi:DUF4239 domain-containing protein [Methylocapsa sp. D3K7]|uniref:bestrophin-like domain n=1 Tax=Methylocapsa sp. D3K7 TaxID=3041435 RepID=UPI00244EEA16|nr:DUF4239 domain-containing protein [Methylocapsa sp. D3K7]WGJ16424.1 DUF4239 domain-containing protein [Methylocapsa sp. D3K7]